MTVPVEVIPFARRSERCAGSVKATAIECPRPTLYLSQPIPPVSPKENQKNIPDLWAF